MAVLQKLAKPSTTLNVAGSLPDFLPRVGELAAQPLVISFAMIALPCPCVLCVSTDSVAVFPATMHAESDYCVRAKNADTGSDRNPCFQTPQLQAYSRF